MTYTLNISNDPHGLILTLIAVSTVFCCLLVLWGVYSLMGSLLSPKKEKTELKLDTKADEVEEVAIAIAVAYALEEAKNDKEITFSPTDNTGWKDPSANFRHQPNRL